MADGEVLSPESFRAFYRAYLPLVYGYLLRLCAGDKSQAEDLTQDVWFALVDELKRGHTERADVRWLMTVARSRFIDYARRERIVRSKIAVLRGIDERVDVNPTSGQATRVMKSMTTSVAP